VMTVKINFYNY